MSSFTSPLVVEKINNRFWRTYRSFRYYVGSLNSSEFIDVPINFITDFASIPRIFWIILTPDGQYTQAAVLHDWLCEKKIYSHPYTCNIFEESMLVLKVPKLIARLMKLAVQFFGPKWDN